MPRYCAVKLCKNRGGIPSKDNKRISFYPFPLRDEARLQKWVDNMKREEWTPSRHQYLCSEHFTEDSFDLRWGIRYLKQTAIPTIFPYIYDDDMNRIHNKKNSQNSKPKTRMCDANIQLIRSSSPPRKKPLILRREETAQVSINESHAPTVLLIRDLMPDAEACPAEVAQVETLLSGTCEAAVCGSTTELPGEQVSVVRSCVRVPAPTETVHQQLDAGLSVTVLCCGTAAPFTELEAERDTLHTQLGQTVRILPAELEGEDPTDSARELEGEEPTDSARELEGEDPTDSARELDEADSEHTSLDEHSYSRHDTDKEQLWSKIASLHTKIMELDRREETTIAKVRSVESEIDYLKKQNIVCEEKQKALEDYFTSVFL